MINEQNKFLKYNFSEKPADDTVHVSIDESLKGTALKKTEKQIEAEKKEYFNQKIDLIGSNTNSKLGLESSLGKDERIFKLKSAVSAGKVVTVDSACKYLGLKTRKTIIEYAIEGKIELFDEINKKWVGDS